MIMTNRGWSGFDWRVCDQNHAAFEPVDADESKIRTPIQILEQALALILIFSAIRRVTSDTSGHSFTFGHFLTRSS